jgi:hypothetical protein
MAFLIQENDWIYCESEDLDLADLRENYNDDAEFIKVPEELDEICLEGQYELERLFNKHKHQQ